MIEPRIALSTEAQPLMPHAQGTSPGRAAATRTRANGNGSPMKNASGAISTNDTAILSASGSGISQRNSDGGGYEMQHGSRDDAGDGERERGVPNADNPTATPVASGEAD